MNDAAKSGRLPEPSTPPGAAKWYFVVINTCGGKETLGWESHGEVTLGTAGRIVRACWLDVPMLFANVTLGRFSIMPDHIRAVIRIAPGRPGPAGVAPRPNAKRASPLRRVIAGFKLRSTMRVNRAGGSFAAPLWDRGHYARLIHSAQELALMQARAGGQHPPPMLLPVPVASAPPRPEHDPSPDPPSRAA